MGEIRLDHIQIAAPPGCEAEARRFFGDLIGLPEVEKPEPLRQRGGVWFAVGSHQLHVGAEPEFAPARKDDKPIAVRISLEIEFHRRSRSPPRTWTCSPPGSRAPAPM